MRRGTPLAYVACTALVLGLASSTAVFLPGVAAAQGGDPVVGESLYKEGRKRLAADDWGGACASFDTSMSANPAAGAAIHVARCREREGRLTAALTAYESAVALAQEQSDPARRKALLALAVAGRDGLSPRVPRLRLTLDERPAGLLLTLDGRPFTFTDEPMAVDPGKHQVVASAPGHVNFQRTATLREGELLELHVILTPMGAAEAPLEPPPPARVWPWVVLGAGVATLGAAVAFRIDGAAAESSLVEHCGEELRCDGRDGYDPADDNARKDRDFGLFVALGIAGIGAATVGVVGLMTEPDGGPSVSLLPFVGPSSVGLLTSGKL